MLLRRYEVAEISVCDCSKKDLINGTGQKIRLQT